VLSGECCPTKRKENSDTLRSKKVNVLVTGTGAGGVGEGVVKALKMDRQKYRIVATDMNPMSATLLRVDKGYILPEASDEKYIGKLLNICKRENVSAVIPGSVPELKELSNAREIFEQEGIALIIGPKNVIDVCLDKWESYKFLKMHGFPYPKTYLSEDSDRAASELGFPVFVKPREGYGSRHTYVIHDKEELDIIGRYLRKIRVEFMIQEYVDTKECTVGVVASKHGRILGSISILREIKTGFSYRMTVTDVKEARMISEELSSKFGSIGPMNIQLFITQGKPVIFEINPRFSGTTPIRSAVGFREVDATLRSFLFEEENQLTFKSKVIVIRYLDEIYASSSAFDELQKDGYTSRKGWRKRYF
jgi:carbamoyl-phosphate synthase large subunit